MKVGINPHIGLAQGYKGRHMQDPRGGKVMQLQAIELQQRTTAESVEISVMAY
jgi:hypothetical protein